MYFVSTDYCCGAPPKAATRFVLHCFSSKPHGNKILYVTQPPPPIRLPTASSSVLARSAPTKKRGHKEWCQNSRLAPKRGGKCTKKALPPINVVIHRCNRAHLACSWREKVVHIPFRVRVARLHHKAVASGDGHVVVVPFHEGARQQKNNCKIYEAKAAMKSFAACYDKVLCTRGRLGKNKVCRRALLLV